MEYQVIKEHRGKVKLQSGEGETLLDQNTPQAVLAQLYEGSDLAKGFIEPVTVAPAVVAQTK